MTSSKTKRVAAVTALAASLLVGGVAAAQADEPACKHGKGKGLGQGAPGKGKGKGFERGWPHGCKDKDHSDDDDNNTGGGSETPGGGGSETPGGGGSETPGGGGSETPSGEVDGSSNGSGVVVDVNVEVDLPDAGQIAQETVQDALGILTPMAENVVGEALETAGQATELAKNDVAGIVDLLDAAKAGATSLPGSSADAGFSLTGTNLSGTVNVSGGTASGATTLANQLLGGAFGIVGATTTGMTGIVAGAVLPF